MERSEFDRILITNGFIDAPIRDELWRTKPSVDLDVVRLAKTAKWLDAQLPELLAKIALNHAMDREFGRD